LFLQKRRQRQSTTATAANHKIGGEGDGDGDGDGSEPWGVVTVEAKYCGDGGRKIWWRRRRNMGTATATAMAANHGGVNGDFSENWWRLQFQRKFVARAMAENRILALVLSLSVTLSESFAVGRSVLADSFGCFSRIFVGAS